jgi:hypothetical protein
MPTKGILNGNSYFVQSSSLGTSPTTSLVSPQYAGLCGTPPESMEFLAPVALCDPWRPHGSIFSPIRRPSLMDLTLTVFVRHSRRLLCAGLFLTITSTTGLADDRCQQLVALNQQYAGVQLTSAQKLLKSQLVAWYRQNCRSSRSADSRR